MGYKDLPENLWPRAAFVARYGRRPRDQAELDAAVKLKLITVPTRTEVSP